MHQDRLEAKTYELAHRPFFMFALFSSTSMTLLGGTIIATSIPSLESHFAEIPHIDILSKLVLSLPALFILFFSPITGILVDRYGKLKFLLPFMFLWSFSGLLGGVYDNIYWILGTRAIFGIAAAFLITSTGALIADYYKGDERQKALGLNGFAAACGGAIFTVIGGFLAQYDWRYPFFVYSFGFFVTLLAYISLFEPRKSKKAQIDLKDNANFSFKSLLSIYFLAFMLMIAYYVAPTQVPQFIIDTLQEGEIFVGICVSASAFSYGISSLFYNRIRKFLSIRSVYIVGFASMGIGFLMIFLFHNLYSSFIGLLIMGAGSGAVFTNNYYYLLLQTPTHKTGRSLGILSAMICLGQFLSPFISQVVVREAGIVSVFLFVAILLFSLSFITFVGLKRRP